MKKIFKFVVDWIKQNRLLSLAIVFALALLAFAHGSEIKTGADLFCEGFSKIAADISVLWNNLELSKQTIAKIAAAIILIWVVLILKTWLHFVIWFVLFFGTWTWSESVTPIKSINGLLMLPFLWFGFLYPFWFLFKRIGLNFAAVKTHARLHIRLCLQVSIIALLCFLVLFSFIFLWRISVVLSLFVFAFVIGGYVWAKSMQQLEKTQIKQSLFEFIFHEKAQSLEKTLLNQLPESQKEYYQSHIRWQFELAWVKAKIAWKQVELSQWFAKHRWFWVFISALFTLFVVYSLVPKEIPSVLQTHYNDLFISPSSAANAENLFIKAIGSDGAWTFIILVLGLFTAFVLWWFRDINKRHEIENARKDTNLKDFQQICQWAAGEHLKDRNPIVVYCRPQNKRLKTQTQSNEGLDDLNDTLRISAVHQLAAFVRGDFGEHFKRPAFVLLKTLWLNLVKEHLEKWDDKFDKYPQEFNEFNYSPETDKHVLASHIEYSKQFGFVPYKVIREQPIGKEIQKWRDELKRITQTPLGHAINYALVQKNGKVLRDHAKDLPNACFAGLNFNLPNVDQPIDLSGLDMSGIDMRWSDIDNTLFNNSILIKSKLIYSVLKNINLTNANLTGIDLRHSYISDSKLLGTILCESNLENTHLLDVDLSNANIEKATLKNTTLRNVDFKKVNVTNTIIRRIFIDPAKLIKNADTVVGVSTIENTTMCSDSLTLARLGFKFRKAIIPLKKEYIQNLAECLYVEDFRHKGSIGNILRRGEDFTDEEIKEWLSPLWCVDDDCRQGLLKALIEAVKKRLDDL